MYVVVYIGLEQTLIYWDFWEEELHTYITTKPHTDNVNMFQLNLQELW